MGRKGNLQKSNLQKAKGNKDRQWAIGKKQLATGIDNV
jgi:hypothetical protein